MYSRKRTISRVYFHSYDNNVSDARTMSATSEVLFFFVTLAIIILILYYYFDRRGRPERQDPFIAYGITLGGFNPDRLSLQQEDIFNISSRVQGQETEWNTRDLTHVTISQHMHKPPYDDAPPSYEEAMRLAMAASLETSNGNNNSHSSSVQIQSVVVEEPKPVSSTSTSN